MLSFSISTNITYKFAPQLCCSQPFVFSWPCLISIGDSTFQYFFIVSKSLPINLFSRVVRSGSSRRRTSSGYFPAHFFNRAASSDFAGTELEFVNAGDEFCPSLEAVAGVGRVSSTRFCEVLLF